ncbi:MAG: hypothetical protein EOP83_14495 [Verrucomicrobiaceae bacterium]|nr:MAG: hypothetical protein EOP83_14495 [Verrucomicrobiaceae bacterium]
MTTLANRVTNIGENLHRTYGYNMASHAFRDARIAATIRAGLFHVEVKDWNATLNWLRDNGDPDYTFSMDDFWFDDANLAFEVKMRFG